MAGGLLWWRRPAANDCHPWQASKRILGEKMAVKLVFTDLDGTFVDSRKRVCERNARVLERAAELGVQLVPCTGRNEIGRASCRERV